MFTKFDKALPSRKYINLSQYKNFEGKFMAAYKYSKIREAFFEVSNPQDLGGLPVKHLFVTRMVIHPPQLALINSTLQECLKILSNEVTIYINGSDNFEKIAQTLQRCITVCNRAFGENNINNRMTFDQNFTVKIYKEEKWYPTSYSFLEWSNPSIYEDFRQHFNIRKDFFAEMLKPLTQGLEFHLSKSEPSKTLYSWDSPKAELEISELLYILYRTS